MSITLKKIQMISKIDGVRDYLLVRRDGAVVSKDTENGIAFASTIVMSGISGEKMEKYLGSKRFTHMVAEKTNEGALIIFSLGNFFLGVFTEADINCSLVLKRVSTFLRKLLKTGDTGTVAETN